MGKSEPLRVHRIMVVGTGVMGCGIAAVAAAHGFDTLLFDADPEAVARGREAISASWRKAHEKGKMSTADIEAAGGRLVCLERLLQGAAADLVIEAIPEALDLKRMLFHELDGICGERTILASNTSSLSISRIASATRRPDRVVGLHFFNPVAVMPLVEIVAGSATSPDTVESVRQVAQRLEKLPIVVADSPGFATSRLGVALGLEAMRMLEEGVASASDIDRAMEAGYGHAMGPLKTSDLVGLDVRLAIAETLATGLGQDRFEPPRLLRRLVEEGKLGKKTGEGFYRWEGNAPLPVDHADLVERVDRRR
jgi:3-hydroxybutyryl-CoA dehydrogenase